MPPEKQNQEVWLPVREVARLAGKSERNIRVDVRNKAFQGAPITVRELRGRGGISGRRYEILLGSLPIALKAAWHKEHSDVVASRVAAEQIELVDSRRQKNAAWSTAEREARHATFSKMPTSIQAEAKRRLPYVRLFHSLFPCGLSLGDRYAAVAREAGESVSTIRRWCRACKGLDAGDWMVALAPAYGTRDYQPTISADAWGFIRSEYLQVTKPSLKPIWRRATIMARANGWTIPSYSSVTRMVDQLPNWERVMKREGKESFERLHPPQQRDYSALRVHAIWCGDGRKADVFARWENGTIGRPIVLAWMEVRTRVLLGYCIGKVESADLIRLAFKDAATKSRALPDEVLIDNGRGFAAKLLTGGTPNRFRFKVKAEDPLGIFPLLGVRVIWAQPYRGRAKPIESFWRQIAEGEKRFPGAYCGNCPDTRPEDCDPEKAIPIGEFRKLVDDALLVYHQTPHRGDSMNRISPRAMYEALLANTPVRSPTSEQLRLCMLAAEQIKLDSRDSSVQILGNRYWSERLADLSPNRLYTARFNPQDASDPIAIYEGGRFVCQAALLSRTGFRDQQAAKDHMRATRQFTRARKDQERASRDKRTAATWLTGPGSADDPAEITQHANQAMLPPPTIPRLVKPQQSFRRVEQPPEEISTDEAQDALRKFYSSR